MKRLLLFLLTFIFTFSQAQAQKGKNKIGIGGEIAFPTSDFGQVFKTGFGGWAKFLLGVGTKSDQVTISTGYTNFSAKGSGSSGSASIGIIPLLIGYRTSFDGLYLEPQIGYGSYQLKVNAGGINASDSRGAFTYAIGLGFIAEDIDFGVRYQSGQIEGDNYGNVAVRIGYNFALRNRNSK